MEGNTNCYSIVAHVLIFYCFCILYFPAEVTLPCWFASVTLDINNILCRLFLYVFEYLFPSSLEVFVSEIIFSSKVLHIFLICATLVSVFIFFVLYFHTCLVGLKSQQYGGCCKTLWLMIISLSQYFVWKQIFFIKKKF